MLLRANKRSQSKPKEIKDRRRYNDTKDIACPQTVQKFKPPVFNKVVEKVQQLDVNSKPFYPDYPKLRYNQQVQYYQNQMNMNFGM